MGKFTGSLEKAGYDVGMEGLAGAPLPPSSSPSPPIAPVAEEQKPLKPAKPSQSAKPALRATPPPRPAPRQSSHPQPRPGKWDERLFKAVNDDIYLPEIFKIIRARILNPGEDLAPLKTIMVTSVVPKEGKSFITANLGISLARGLDQHCLLVDCDLRRPSLAGLFGLPQGPGLTDYLRDGVALPDLITRTEANKLSILASGAPPVNPAELLSSARMQDLIDELAARYEDRIILFDTPPMLIAAETSLLASQVDKVLLIVRQGRAGKEQVHRLIAAIGPKKILGVVFNDYTASPFERNLEKGYGYYRGGYSS